MLCPQVCLIPRDLGTFSDGLKYRQDHQIYQALYKAVSASQEGISAADISPKTKQVPHRQVQQPPQLLMSISTSPHPPIRWEFCTNNHRLLLPVMHSLIRL